MDLSLLKKQLSTYRTTKGRLTRVPDELAYEILLAWEQWAGPGSGFYSALGVDHRKMASIIGKAKKLKREGVFADSQFKEIKLEPTVSSKCKSSIFLRWGKDKLIQFSQVDQLVEFLNTMERQKAA